MFGDGGSVWTRTTSLDLSIPSGTGSADTYGDYEPTDEHLLNAYSGVSFFVVMLGLWRPNWRASLALAVILLIGRFILLHRVRRDTRTSGNQRAGT
jgi:hypothetical protein